MVPTLARAVVRVLASLAHDGKLGALTPEAVSVAPITLERPKNPAHGDYATNAALVLKSQAGVPPRAIAEALKDALSTSEVFASVEVAGPGFVNLRVRPTVFHAELLRVLDEGRGYGRVAAATGERVNLEFVSANPTGPLLISHGRGACFGDAVGRLLEATGHRVTREYYINDFGNQVRLLADSVRLLAAGKPLPVNDKGETLGYGGDYVHDLIAALGDLGALTDEQLARLCTTLMMRDIRRTLAHLGVAFDVWFSESSLHEWGLVRLALDTLAAKGFLTEKDGAVFFVGQAAEDDKDRVVRRSDGTFTYFASDIAYHADKIDRGYDRLLNVLGADHHGYVPRIKNSLEALGLPADRFEALIFQLVFLYRHGQLVKFGKRKGTIFTLEELLQEIDEAAGKRGAGADAVRYFYLSRSASTNVELDIELAKQNSLDNPVFYVQYGHARLCSIERKAEACGIALPSDLTVGTLAKLVHPDELAIARTLVSFPDIVREAAAGREPHRVIFLVEELARDFQSYFTRMKSDPILPPDSVRATPGWEARWDFQKTHARLVWVRALRTVYASALELCGISAPARLEMPKTGVPGEDGAED